MILESARRLAAALDAEDDAAVRACLTDECVYESPEGVLVGPEAIVASYRKNAELARTRFAKIEYRSEVAATGPAEAVITFVDRLSRAGAWHEFRCRQHVRLAANGLIEHIQHEEIADERERLREFEFEGGGRRAERGGK
jgi:SnoaL-like domain